MSELHMQQVRARMQAEQEASNPMEAALRFMKEVEALIETISEFDLPVTDILFDFISGDLSKAETIKCMEFRLKGLESNYD